MLQTEVVLSAKMRLRDFQFVPLNILSSPCALMTRTCGWVTVLEPEDAGVKGVAQKGVTEC